MSLIFIALLLYENIFNNESFPNYGIIHIHEPYCLHAVPVIT